jgi:hypothetical protein
MINVPLGFAAQNGQGNASFMVKSLFNGFNRIKQLKGLAAT